MVAKPVVVAQLTVRSLPIPEDPGSNPVVGSSYYTFICCELVDENKTKIKQKMPGMVANLKKTFHTCFTIGTFQSFCQRAPWIKSLHQNFASGWCAILFYFISVTKNRYQKEKRNFKLTLPQPPLLLFELEFDKISSFVFRRTRDVVSSVIRFAKIPPL